MQKHHQNTISTSALIGIIFMLLNTVALAISDIASKTLRNELSSGFIVFIYKFGLLIIILPWVLSKGVKYLKTKRIYFHILRSLFGTIAIICFVQGLKQVSMVNAAALENVQYIIVVLLSIVLFNDRLTKTKIAAIIIGFLGACVIVNPDILGNIFCSCNEGENTPNNDNISKYFYTIAAVCCWSVNTLLVKTLGNTENNRTQMFYLLLFASMWSFPAAFIKWNAIDVLGQSMNIMPELYDPGILKLNITHITLLGLMGCCYFIHGIAYFNALKHDLSIVIPFRYTKLIFSGILGYLLFDEKVQGYAIVGYLMVVTSSFMLIRYEIRRRRKKLAAS